MSRHSSSQYNNINNNNNNINNQIPPTELDYEQLAIDVFNEQNRVRTEPQVT